jgi:hypothetical protein
MAPDKYASDGVSRRYYQAIVGGLIVYAIFAVRIVLVLLP